MYLNTKLNCSQASIQKTLNFVLLEYKKKGVNYKSDDILFIQFNISCFYKKQIIEYLSSKNSI